MFSATAENCGVASPAVRAPSAELQTRGPAALKALSLKLVRVRLTSSLTSATVRTLMPCIQALSLLTIYTLLDDVIDS